MSRVLAPLALSAALVCLSSTALQAEAATATLYTAGSNAWPQTPLDPQNPLTEPMGGAVMGNHFWVADALEGFYRLDADPAGARLPDIDFNDLVAFGKMGQVAFDPITSFAFVAESQSPKGNGLGSQGVVALHFDAASDRIDLNRCAFSRELAGRKPDAVAIGPDGEAYIGFSTSGDIVRVDVRDFTNFNVGCAEFPEQTIGKTQFGGRVASLAFIGSDLYIAGVDGLGVIHGATGCASGCTATQVPGSLFRVTHPGVASNGVDTLYYLVNNAVWSYSPATGIHVPVATGGTLPDGTTSGFRFAAGQPNLLQLDGAGNLWVGDDTSDGRLTDFGRVWVIAPPLQ